MFKSRQGKLSLRQWQERFYWWKSQICKLDFASFILPILSIDIEYSKSTCVFQKLEIKDRLTRTFDWGLFHRWIAGFKRRCRKFARPCFGAAGNAPDPV